MKKQLLVALGICMMLFACKKEEQVELKQSINTTVTYEKPANGSIWNVYETFYYKLDSSGVVCDITTDDITSTQPIKFYNDSLFEVINSIASGTYDFNINTGEIILHDNQNVNNQGFIYFEAKLFYKNELLPGDTSIAITKPSLPVLYVNHTKHIVGNDCGATYYEQWRLKE